MTPHQPPFFPFRRHTLALALALAASPVMQAATINATGGCTLYNAIRNANTDTDTDGAAFGCPSGSGADIINLAPKTHYSLLGSGNEDGLPIINSIITINGRGSTVDALGLRAFHISGTGDLTINKLTITHGYAEKGAGILNDGRLRLNDSKVSGNSTFTQCDYYCFGSQGAGIYNSNSGSATLTNSHINNNSAYAGYSINGESGFGGGIYNAGSMGLSNCKVFKNETIGSSLRWTGPIGGGIMNTGTMTIANSSIFGNSASNGGGGIRNHGIMTITNSRVSHNNATSGGGIDNGFNLDTVSNSLTLINSTISYNLASGGAGINNTENMGLSNSTVTGNKASNSGGGIVNKGKLAISHSTLSNNQALANKGGGIFNIKNMTLTNTLIANSKTGGDCINSSSGGGGNSSGVAALQGVNLIEDGGCGADISGDPKLGFLLDNGGYTETHMLRGTSLALDVANKPLCSNQDQRGIQRPQPADGGCDIGAFEKTVRIPKSVSTTVRFFNNAVNSGGIIGTGNIFHASQRIAALRNQLLSAGNYKGQGLNEGSCTQLKRTITRIDTDGTPDANDYATGIQANALVAEITSLSGMWACP
ncbi:choice-of-anchor Q domain-containing protein [Methylovulum miyakonense]|uniref:choice-of-anchor Q domain-containing protein n=1 Tax=Methylovulum miyakonense TaxID=645578 RepID=UPI00035EDFA7|nr:choice-of-anchor Q domain-containing protein [Methylovulum miyakonense]